MLSHDKPKQYPIVYPSALSPQRQLRSVEAQVVCASMAFTTQVFYTIISVWWNEKGFEIARTPQEGSPEVSRACVLSRSNAIATITFVNIAYRGRFGG